MANKTLFLFISLSLLFLVNIAQATERIAVSIGYSDGPDSLWQKAGVADYPYYPGMSQKTVDATIELLQTNGFHQVKNLEFVSSWENADNSIVVDIINPNDRCASAVKLGGELNKEQRSPWLCHEQQTKSRITAKYVRENILLTYDAFIYIGHARYGSGLSYGSFNDEQSKVDIYGLARKYYGGKSRLKIVGIMSCDSMNHYATAFDSLYDSTPPKFVGISAKKIDWHPPVLVGKELQLLQSILVSGGVHQYQQVLPAKSAY